MSLRLCRIAVRKAFEAVKKSGMQHTEALANAGETVRKRFVAPAARRQQYPCSGFPIGKRKRALRKVRGGSCSLPLAYSVFSAEARSAGEPPGEPPALQIAMSPATSDFFTASS